MYIPEEEEIRREKAKARELRASQWWKRKCARGICHWCGKTVAPGDLTMDHVLPLARGGKTTKNNVVPCCKECNIRKKSRMPTHWDNL
ncbi:5-methylcytosine-specific restriction endonuclease McrA [Desulfosalsimonas propionicica]|uniref:5-methylcytosine-specific restriction endonuclease McrA n=1 Tax=Desulfosalsimonas propionicica TaxID=332175 RepID=A0A7W0C6W3_9BACT|nr:HNH endonuclease [Desulfosalsimonas propionicica]MBA2880288.1 5-methylcytosine-specific restriction endonuclease McrA [Desulfosalsimonas propionicica]